MLLYIVLESVSGAEPDASRGYSLAEEPAIALLADRRLWMNMRPVTGRI